MWVPLVVEWGSTTCCSIGQLPTGVTPGSREGLQALGHPDMLSMDGNSAAFVICSSTSLWSGKAQYLNSCQKVLSTANFLLSQFSFPLLKYNLFNSSFPFSFIAFLANGNRNSPGLPSCYGLCLDGTKLVSRNKPLGSPGWEVMESSQVSLPWENWEWWMVCSSGRLQVFFLLSLFLS